MGHMQSTHRIAKVCPQVEDMVLGWILAALLQECLTTSIVSPEVHTLPSSGVYLSYLCTNTSLYFPSLEGLVPEVVTVQHEALQQKDVSCIGVEYSRTADYGVFCLWNGTGHDAEITAEDYVVLKRIMFPSDSHLVDHTWQLQCAMGENTTQITCTIQYVTPETSMNTEFMPHLYYKRNDKDEDINKADCRCHRHERCECHISPALYNESYILWMEIAGPATSLRSPPMLLRAAAIIQPAPPSDLRAEITSDGKLKVLWSSAASTPRRLQCQVKHYLSTTEKTSPPTYVIVTETYVILDVPESCSPLVSQVRCRRFPALGVWSTWSPPMVLKSQDGYYFPQRVVVSTGSSASVFCTFCDKNKKIPSKAITWGLDLAKQIPSQHYTAVSDYVGKVTIDNMNTTTPKGKFQFDALYCCIHGIECQPRYAEIYVIDTNINICCETNGDFTVMTCRWTPKQIPPLKDIALTFRYYEEINYSFETNIKYDAATEKKCELQQGGSYQCIFNQLKTMSSYYMWVEIQHPSGTLRSPPVSLRPRDVVKPFAPGMVQAEMTVDSKKDMQYLNVTWNRPRFVVEDVFYQLRYRVQGQEAEWQVVDLYKNESAKFFNVDVCRVYTIQVRCQLVNFSDIWSDWTNAIHTVVKDVKEPLSGPEFWRIMTKNTIQKGDKITLVWKPLQKKESLCSVRGYELVQQVSSVISCTTYVGDVTNYTLILQHSAVTLSIRALNSIGPSKKNHNLTLSEDVSAVKAVQSLNMYALNSTVLAVWKMSPVSYDLLGFVLEWRNLRGRSPMRWTYIPPNASRYYIDDQFYTIEKYQFSLTPVFSEGVGSPHITYEFSKEDIDEMKNNTGFYIILPVITATSFLLVITFAISHQRMKRLFWKEVPNPKYCSWAQGVNFQKPDTLENLFMKHRQHLAHNFSFILEPEAIFENLNIDKGWEKENIDNVLIVDRLTDDHDSACTTSHFGSSFTYAVEPDISIYGDSSCQSSVKYATIIGNPQQSKQCTKDRKISLSSGDGCILRNNSIVIGNLEDKKQALLIMAGLHTKEPNMTSSNSTVSSEGFSEPTDQEESFEGDSPERNLYYLGLDSNQNNERDNYFSKNPLVTYHIQENISYQELDFRREKSSKLIENDYGHPGFLKRTLRPYVPQFQIQSSDDTEVFDMCT
ncbi:leptin receptor isoform X2 [Bufo gargarizans]|uniref:leptin receptor isoform X2 n=1 Tax=Bufo gargarizans TaxID=30331 RepID=UPI001CF35D10|nr:leptin receptor isoform X2 [Bufo gargarizans]